MKTNRIKRIMLLIVVTLFSLTEGHALWNYYINGKETIGDITYNLWYRTYSGYVESRSTKGPFKGVGGVTPGLGDTFAFYEVTVLAKDPYHYQGHVSIPSRASSIASGAFANCGALTRVDIPSTIGDGILVPACIKSGAFSNCPALADVYTEAEHAIPNDAFDEYIYSHATLHVPAGKKNTYQNLNGWKNFLNIEEDTEEQELENGDTFTAKTNEGIDMEFEVKDKSTRTIWVGTFQRVAIQTETGGVITIPVKVNGWYVKGISRQAFSGCSLLGGINIPEGIEIIEDNAFADCSSLTSIIIPKSVVSLGNYHPFIGCKSLRNVTVSSGNTIYDSRNNCNGIIETTTNKLIFGTAGMTIPSSVSSIAPVAFSQNTELAEITIPEGVVSIGRQAFLECNNLHRIDISKTVTHLDKEIFVNCYNLSQISVDTNNPVYDSRDNCNAIIETATNTLVEGGNSTVIPASVKHIGECAFGARQYLNSIKLPEGLTSIGVNAFWLCTGLKDVTIPASVQSIEDFAFEGCLDLQDVYSMIESPFDINDNVFNVTYEVQDGRFVQLSTNYFTTATLHVPAGSKAKYQQAAGWKNFQNIVEMEPASPNIQFADAEVKRICVENWDTNGDGELSEAEASAVINLGSVFKGNTNITSFDELRYFRSLPEIGYNVFEGCSNLQSVSISGSVIVIGSFAFRGCTQLSSVKLPESSFPYGVTSIGEQAFAYCKNLTSIALPTTVDKIGRGAFAGTSIASIDLPEQLTTIGEQAFASSKLTSLSIPKSVSNIGIGIVGNCKEMQSLTVDAANSWYRSAGNAIIDRSTNMLMNACPVTVIPTDIDGIGINGYIYVQGVEEINIPKNVRTIGIGAFEECRDLKRVIIPSAIESIGEQAFLECKNLEQVTMLSPTPVAINENVFHMTETWNEDMTEAVTSDFTTATLYVPDGSKAAYQQAAGWKNFQNIVEMEAPDITITLDESSKLSVYWFAANSSQTGGNKDEIHVNVPVPSMPGASIHNWQNPVYDTFRKNKPQLTVLGADASEVTPLLAFRSAGNLWASSNGEALLCDADTIAKVNGETGVVTMVMSNSTMSLLNRAASDDYVNALTLPLCIKGRYYGTVYNVAGGDFTAKVLRPINAKGKELAKQDITTDTAMLNIGDLVTLTDWRNYSINTRDLFDYFDIESITVTGATNSSNVGSAIKTNVNGSWVSVSSATNKLTLTYQPKSLSATAVGIMPDYGTLTIANNGLSGDMQLLIPLTVSYAWGNVHADAYVSVAAVQSKPELVMTEMVIDGDGIVGTPHTYTVYITNQGQGDFSGSVYVWAKENNWSEPVCTSWVSETIEAGSQAWFEYNDGEYYFFYFSSPGTYHFWLTTDAEGQQPIEGEKILVVTPAATLTAKNYAREYGEENPDFGYTADKGGFSGTPKITCEADRYSDVGTYRIVIEQGTVDNEFVTLVPGTLTITKAPLTIAAGDWLNRQGLEPKNITPSYGTFKNSEDKSVLTKEPQFSTTATAESPIGSVHQLTFSGAEAKNYSFTYIPGTITIIGRPGDVNRDSYINTTDAVDMIQEILGYNSLLDIFDGDLYRDYQITTADLQQVVLYILNNEQAVARRTATHPAANNSLLGLTLDEQGHLAVTLSNDMPFTGFQFDVTLPDGTNLSQVLLSELRRDGHSVTMRHMDDGSYRVLVYSMQNNALRGSNGVLVTFLTSPIDGDVTVSNIHFADIDCTNHQLPDVSLSMLTGISTHTEEASTFNIYDLNGRLVRRNATSTKGLHRGVYMINNQKVVIK